MAITTLDQVIAGAKSPIYFAKAGTGTVVVGRMVSLWGVAGIPGPGSYNGTLNGVNLDSTSAQVAGQLRYNNASPGSNNYLARFQASTTNAGTLFLCDRLWHNGGITITSTAAQNITQPTLPARDADGATAGSGVLIGVEVSALTGVGTPTITISYTNSAGVAGRTATNIVATVASASANTFYQMGLQAGDEGVRSVQSITLSATWTSGTINLVAYRVMAALDLGVGNAPNAIDALTAGFPEQYDGTVPYMMYLPGNTTSTFTQGSLVWTQG